MHKHRKFSRLRPFRRKEAAFSLLEVIIAASILAMGLLSIMQVFPYGLATSRRAEDLTQASLLAQTIFEGIKTDPLNFPIIPGLENVVIPLPGNAYDDDWDNAAYNVMQSRRYNQYDLNRNRIPDADYDGMPEADGVRYPGVQPNGLDDDGDGVIDDDGDSGSRNRAAVPSSFTARAADGDFYYDPEPEIDEEYANGKDDDRDGLIDEDVRLASVRVLGGMVRLPILTGDGYDNDGDGEDDDGDPRTPARADGIDNNGDGRIDEGIDEEIWDGFDNDGDGLIDEDCQFAAFPFSPAKFPKPYDRYSWQIRVGSVPDNGRYGLEDINGDGIPDLGDGIDNDGDGLVDEELPDGLDYDFPVQPRPGLAWLSGYNRPPIQDGLVDEDTIAGTLPNWRRVEVIITWGGDGIDNDGDLTRVDPQTTGTIGEPATSRGNRSRSRVSYGQIEWGIDEEKLDGIDNDFDGEIDEDCYLFDFKLVGFINLSNPGESFVLKGGQPRGITGRDVAAR
jgi:type II secretory pathway pseudopilin PulG